MAIGITDLIAGIFQPAADLVDNLHTSKEEKLNAKAQLLDVQAAAMDSAFSYERGILEARAKIVETEANSDHWLAANWRPLIMLGFFGLVMGDTFGWLPNPLSDDAWTLLKIGLGGYVGGRSAEKITRTVMGARRAAGPSRE